MKLRILPQMMLYIVTPMILCMGIMVFMSVRQAQTALDAQINDEMTRLADLQRRDLSNIYTLLGGVAVDYANNSLVQAMLNPSAPEEEAASLSLRVQALTKKLVDVFPYIVSAGVIDAKGVLRDHSASQLVGTFYGDRQYFKSVTEKRALTTDVVIGRSTNSLSTIIAAPVFAQNDAKKLLGAVFLSVDLLKLAEVSTNTITVGTTGYAVLLDRTGMVLMHPRKEMQTKNLSNMPWVRDILGKNSGSFSYEWEGAIKIAAFAKVPELEQTLLITVEHDDIMTPVRALLYSNLAVAGGAMVLLACIIFIVVRGFSSTLRRSVTMVQGIAAGNFDLTAVQRGQYAQDCARGDEIAELAVGIGQMRENLISLFAQAEQKSKDAEKAEQEARVAAQTAEEARQQAVQARREGMLAAASSLESVVEVVSSVSERLEAQLRASEQGAATQAQRVAETATAMDQMNGTVRDVAHSAEAASEVSAATRTKAEAGATVVQHAVSSIQQVQAQSTRLKEDMMHLDASAKAISQIMAVISDIADQTNLLALNAAIEAARAGDAGRGFAVVADEVRKLAEKTQLATAEVGKAVKAIQDNAGQSAAQVEASVKSIEEATGFANQSGVALQEIVRMAESTAQQVRTIASASDEQAGASAKINSAIGEVNAISGETVDAMRAAAESVNELAAQAQVLVKLIEDMKRG